MFGVWERDLDIVDEEKTMERPDEQCNLGDISLGTLLSIGAELGTISQPTMRTISPT